MAALLPAAYRGEAVYLVAVLLNGVATTKDLKRLRFQLLFHSCHQWKY